MSATTNFQDQVPSRNAENKTIVQDDGTRVTVRPAQMSDVVPMTEMHERLSKDSIYYRYLSANKPSTEDLQRLCSADDQIGTVLVATVDEPREKVIAIACYRVDPSNRTSAEPAILVEDGYQGRGLGKRIIRTLFRDAIQNGISTFVSYIHPVNQRVLRMIKGSGLPYESKYNDGMKEVRIWLSPNA
jgi:L-amino acid N-acyltransferase YncA